VLKTIIEYLVFSQTTTKLDMTVDNDDYKYSKKKVINIATDAFDRRLKFYALFCTLLWDVHVSKAAVLEHLTIWSWILHLLYFDLPLSSPIVAYLHGPSLGGSAALFIMYIWTLIANPNMEFDLAPPGRSDLVIYARAFWLHFIPVVFHYTDLKTNAKALRLAYRPKAGPFFTFWVSVAGYLTMGLTWEQLNKAADVYNVTLVSPEIYVNVSKALGILGCLTVFLTVTKPNLMP
jgi:hypothetical protein